MLIANTTRMLRDSLYDEIRTQPDLEVVGDVSEPGAIASAVARTGPDCVIVPLDDPGSTPERCAEMLAASPQLRIVGVGEGTNIVAVYWMADDSQMRCTYMTATKEGILRAIRYPAS